MRESSRRAIVVVMVELVRESVEDKGRVVRRRGQLWRLMNAVVEEDVVGRSWGSKWAARKASAVVVIDVRGEEGRRGAVRR